MGDVTISEGHYNRLKEDATKQRAEAKLAREQAEKAGVAAWKAGRKGEGLMLMGGANAPMLQAVFTGAALYWAATGDWFNKITLFKEHWWLKPLLALAFGYWLFRRQSPWAGPALATAAALFVQAWKARPESRKDKGRDTQGPDDDAGRWDWSEDTYGARGRFEAPHGGRAYMREGQGANDAERIADRVFEHARTA